MALSLLMKVLRTSEFERWLTFETPKIQALVEARVYRIEHYDHFGDAKYLGDGLSELRWKNGLRVYFARTGEKVILLINGGRKHEQTQDIKKARLLLQRYAHP